MAKMQVDKALIRDLAELLNETNLSEIEVEEGQSRIRVARSLSVNAAVAGAPVYAAAPAPVAEAPAATQAEDATHPGAVTSPMVGTAYTAAEPDSPAFVSVGSHVKAGQTILIVEAMKVMNAIASPRDGTVKKIMVTNAQPVEFGEILMIIE
ncbi:acetyl-CoA carboxylase biotin carboxyl carrier protein [Govanella unica]|uniref:Biotin carboxyl carrier protein of acetyl-CoA carboxylase n=1 Tax=Govanella unica TaxID=2975056 RepID=A0A9X3Z6Z3_9PROT|nr:acetyl-CoA carboxylase biotin carboxyl carrier protein [Govania unica]MDA5193533.1 acetyl-CoA carboxylase biotin carboxyl carrier protein [Govania unica]